MTRFLPSLDAAKAQARAFRANQAAQGRLIPHAAALEVIAQSFGYRDWNTFHAAIGNAPRPPVMVGDLVPGHYLKQAFLGEVLSAVSRISAAGFARPSAATGARWSAHRMASRIWFCGSRDFLTMRGDAGRMSQNRPLIPP